ncbi:hypothetical protein K501DRAFT_337644 [Backusella circina FSU 941]|nr:hypothetical protein K501DRAFT_337644 [Backusella circina FSU 941]
MNPSQPCQQLSDMTHGSGLHINHKHFEQSNLIAHQQQELERLYEVQRQAALQQQMAMQQIMYHQQYQYQYQEQQQQQQQQQQHHHQQHHQHHHHHQQEQEQHDYLQMYQQQAHMIPYSSSQDQTKPEKKAQKRAEHNAIERARRESLNSKFQQLAHSLPNLHDDHRPSKGTIIERTLEFVKQTVQKEELFQDEIEKLKKANRYLFLRMADSVEEEDEVEDDEENKTAPTPECDDFSSKSSVSSASYSPSIHNVQLDDTSPTSNSSVKFVCSPEMDLSSNSSLIEQMTGCNGSDFSFQDNSITDLNNYTFIGGNRFST